MTIAQIEKDAVSVVSMLEKAKTWLATAVATTGPEDIAAAKAQIRTAAVYARELGLSKEIQDDATEMVRRAEYALRKATTQAQAQGEVRSREDNLRNSRSAGTSTSTLPSARDFFTTESEYRDANAMAELDEDEFEAAIAEAREEGDLSRPHIVAKARERSGKPQQASRRKPLPDFARDAGWELRRAVERLERIADDDRFVANKEQVASQLRSHLTNAVEVCQTLLSRIDNN